MKQCLLHSPSTKIFTASTFPRNWEHCIVSDTLVTRVLPMGETDATPVCFSYSSVPHIVRFIQRIEVLVIHRIYLHIFVLTSCLFKLQIIHVIYNFIQNVADNVCQGKMLDQAPLT